MTKYKLKHPSKLISFIVLVIVLILTIIAVLSEDSPSHAVKVVPVSKPVYVEQVSRFTPDYGIYECIEPKKEIEKVVESAPKVVEKVVEPVVVHKQEKVSRHKDASYTKEDLELLARLIHCEAGIDGMNGKLAVGTVVMNRMENSNKKMFGGPTLEGVVYHKLKGAHNHQFSCVDDKDLWSEKLEKDDYEAARKILEGFRMFRSTFLYYYNPKICNGISGISCTYAVGMHTFGEE